MTQQRADDRITGTNSCVDSGVRIVTGLRAATQSIAWIGAKSGTFEISRT